MQMYELLNFACVSLCTGKWCQPGLQYWVLVLVLDLYLSTVFKYWYWYLHELHHLYIPVSGIFLQKNLPN